MLRFRIVSMFLSFILAFPLWPVQCCIEDVSGKLWDEKSVADFTEWDGLYLLEHAFSYDIDSIEGCMPLYDADGVQTGVVLYRQDNGSGFIDPRKPSSSSASAPHRSYYFFDFAKDGNPMLLYFTNTYSSMFEYGMPGYELEDSDSLPFVWVDASCFGVVSNDKLYCPNGSVFSFSDFEITDKAVTVSWNDVFIDAVTDYSVEEASGSAFIWSYGDEPYEDSAELLMGTLSSLSEKTGCMYDMYKLDHVSVDDIVSGLMQDYHPFVFYGGDRLARVSGVFEQSFAGSSLLFLRLSDLAHHVSFTVAADEMMFEDAVFFKIGEKIAEKP